jgi:hypothetical protein
MVLRILSTVHSFHNQHDRPHHNYLDHNSWRMLPSSLWHHAGWMGSCLYELVLPRLFAVPRHHNHEHQFYNDKHQYDECNLWFDRRADHHNQYFNDNC